MWVSWALGGGLRKVSFRGWEDLLGTGSQSHQTRGTRLVGVVGEGQQPLLCFAASLGALPDTCRT